MMHLKRYIFFLHFFISLTFSDDLEVKPIVFTLHSSNGSDWVYDKTPLTSFGAGFSFEYQNPNWYRTHFFLKNFFCKLDQ